MPTDPRLGKKRAEKAATEKAQLRPPNSASTTVVATTLSSSKSSSSDSTSSSSTSSSATASPIPVVCLNQISMPIGPAPMHTSLAQQTQTPPIQQQNQGPIGQIQLPPPPPPPAPPGGMAVQQNVGNLLQSPGIGLAQFQPVGMNVGGQQTPVFAYLQQVSPPVHPAGSPCYANFLLPNSTGQSPIHNWNFPQVYQPMTVPPPPFTSVPPPVPLGAPLVVTSAAPTPPAAASGTVESTVTTTGSTVNNSGKNESRQSANNSGSQPGNGKKDKRTSAGGQGGPRKHGGPMQGIGRNIFAGKDAPRLTETRGFSRQNSPRKRPEKLGKTYYPGSNASKKRNKKNKQGKQDDEWEASRDRKPIPLRPKEEPKGEEMIFYSQKKSPPVPDFSRRGPESRPMDAPSCGSPEKPPSQERERPLPASYGGDKEEKLNSSAEIALNSSRDEQINETLEEGEVVSQESDVPEKPNVCQEKSAPAKTRPETEKRGKRKLRQSASSTELNRSRECDPNWTNPDFEDVGESDLSKTDEELLAGSQEIPEAPYWSQCTPARLYYRKKGLSFFGTDKLKELQNQFRENLVDKYRRAKESQPKQEPPPGIKPGSVEMLGLCCCGHKHEGSSGSESEDQEELAKKLKKVKHRSRRNKEEKQKNEEKKSKKKKVEESSESERLTSSSSSSDNSSDSDSDSSSSSDSTSSSSNSNSNSESDTGVENLRFKMAQEELTRKQEHPARLHKELWFNEIGQMNDGPLCRCSWKSRQAGIRHFIFPGEKKIEPCDSMSNNLEKLHHYVMKIVPLTNMKTRIPTTIFHDDHEYSFEGFSMFSHQELPEKIPPCKLVRWNIEYTISLMKEDPPDSFAVGDLELFYDYFFVEILEMYDVSRRAHDVDDGCPIFHFYPRFSRALEDNGKEILSMSAVLAYLKQQSKPVISDEFLATLDGAKEKEWQKFVESLKGQLVTNSEKRPCTIRLDQMDREATDSNAKDDKFPVIVHFGMRPSVLTYAGNPGYQKAWKQYVKFRHLLMMKNKLNSEDKLTLSKKENQLQQMKSEASQKRDVTVELSAKGFHRTGLYSDIVQHGLMLLVACVHIRFHWALKVFETERIKHSFKNRALLELAFTHPSYRTNYGTNPDHARNTLSNCGIRQPHYGRRLTQQVVTRKRGINTLIDIMSRMGSKKVKLSQVSNNERLEYLGDAVIEFLSTIHLFFMFPDLEEGGLATYRSSLVQNKHLAVLAKKLGLDEFMLYAHGPDLCHEADLKHAMANAFEAVMGALFLDVGLQEVDRAFGDALFPESEDEQLSYVWKNLPKHPLQEQELEGDRHWVDQVASLKKLMEFEKRTGIYFNHIRLLAKAFTRRNVGYNFLTLGHNQRLEFLGDTVLQLITSEYLYKHFPEHHEGHLSLLRSCLVNNKTQSVICDDLGMTEFVVHPPAFLKNGPPELRLKDKADLVEAFLGALYVDRGIEPCKVFCKVCFYPRLKYFIVSQRWNDPKSQLQQCCLTLRNPDGGEPDIPQYKVIRQEGPTNTREYEVAVYFRHKRLATGRGHSIQEAEMKAAERALKMSNNLFPYLNKQKSFVERRFNDGRRRVLARGGGYAGYRTSSGTSRTAQYGHHAGLGYAATRGGYRGKPFVRRYPFHVNKTYVPTAGGLKLKKSPVKSKKK